MLQPYILPILSYAKGLSSLAVPEMLSRGMPGKTARLRKRSTDKVAGSTPALERGNSAGRVCHLVKRAIAGVRIPIRKKIVKSFLKMAETENVPQKSATPIFCNARFACGERDTACAAFVP